MAIPNRTDRGKEGEVRFEFVEFALVGGAHGRGANRRRHLRLEVLLTAQFGEFTEAGLEDALHAAGVVATVHRAVEERIEIAARPEVTLELLGLAALLLDREILAENVVPAHERDAGEQQHDGLDDRAGVEDEMEDRQVLRDVHCRVSSLARSQSGMGADLNLAKSMQTIWTVAAASSVQLPSASSPARVLAEDDLAAAELVDFQPDLQQVVEAAGAQIVDADVVHDEDEVVFLDQVLLVVAELTQPFGAAALEEIEVFRVVDDAAGIGFRVVDADRDREGVRLLFVLVGLIHWRILTCCLSCCL